MTEVTTAGQSQHNAAIWSAGQLVSDYDNRVLEPAEVLLLARYREGFTGRVLDAGCGAGRLLGYLVQLGADVVGLDISAAMVERAREHFPDADLRVGDLADLRAVVQGPFDVVLISDNLLDVFEDAERRRVLGEARELLGGEGVLIFSSHNLASQSPRSPQVAPAPLQRIMGVLAHAADRSPLWMLQAVLRLPRRRANRRRLGPRQYRRDDHAVLNDSAHDYSLLHYYIGRDGQARQLADVGLELVEALEFDGRPVEAGREGEGASLYYVARPA
jgi:SAM-dependent methyltransferase